jgi:hypothetical protein
MWVTTSSMATGAGPDTPSGTGTKRYSGWRAGSGALKWVWKTVTAKPLAWRMPASRNMGLMWPWYASGNSSTWRRRRMPWPAAALHLHSKAMELDGRR